MWRILMKTDVLSLPDTLKITLIGLTVVFFVLAVLIAFIELLHALFKDKKPARAKAEEKRMPTGTPASVPRAQDAPDDPAFLAAVSAAIAVTIGTNQFTICSVSEKQS